MNKENHFEYTMQAIKLYEKFIVKTFLSENNSLLIAQGAWDEDEYNLLTLDFQRPMNWHFYNNGNKIINNKLIPGVRTSEARVHRLIEKALKEKKRFIKSSGEEEQNDYLENLFSHTGRLIHHIQDMSTFSHVVPVYHGPGLKDSYETYSANLCGKMKIVLDEEPEDATYSIIFSSDELRESSDDHGGGNRKQLFDCYRLPAEESLQILKDEKHGFFITSNGEKKKASWNYFWKEDSDIGVGICPTIDNKNQGFGAFGELCNNFGKKSFEVGENHYEIEAGEYLKIYKVLMKKSIKDTVRVLSLIFADL